MQYLTSYPGGYWGVGAALYVSLWLLSAGAAALFILIRRSQWLQGIALYAACALLAVFLLTAPIRVTPDPPVAFRLSLYWINFVYVLAFSAMLLVAGGLIRRLVKPGGA